MAWPPTLPPTTRTNTTPQLDTHTADHNQLANALTVLVAKAAVANPWRTSIALVPGTGGVNQLVWSRIGPRVFVDAAWNAGSAGWSLGTGAVQLTLPWTVSPTMYPAAGSSSWPRVGHLQCELTPQNSVWGILDLSVSPNRVLFITGTTAAAMDATHLGKANSVIMGSFSYLTDAAP